MLDYPTKTSSNSMSFLFSRGPPRRGPILCIIALLFLLVLYQLGIICSAPKEPTAVMVAKEVRKASFFLHSLRMLQLKHNRSSESFGEQFFTCTKMYRKSLRTRIRENIFSLHTRGQRPMFALKSKARRETRELLTFDFISRKRSAPFSATSFLISSSQASYTLRIPTRIHTRELQPRVVGKNNA